MGSFVSKLLRLVISLVLVLALTAGGVVVAIMGFSGYATYKSVTTSYPVTEAIADARSKDNYTTLDEIPQIYLDAVIAAEDHRFYEHNGIDLLATLRAFIVDLRSQSFEEGGSTITQQLAKNLYFTQEKSILRKAAEFFVAWEIEKTYTKDEILEIYINNIFYGHNSYCIADASLTYFNVWPFQLSDNQATLLAGVPNAPSVYNPIDNATLALERQKQVLGKMVKYGYLTQEEADTIAATTAY